MQSFRPCILWTVIFLSLSANPARGSGDDPDSLPYTQWTLSRAVALLNSSPWARTETFTKVVGGVGSGVSGEKEIYNTFYVRFLSSRPVREAYARVQQILHAYDSMSEEQKAAFDRQTGLGLGVDIDRWIVVVVSFRSNDPNEESLSRQFFEAQTVETLKNKAFLSTEDVSQVQLAAYFPPLEEGVGAKFVFPRHVKGIPVVTGKSGQFVFELLEVPGADPQGQQNSRTNRRTRAGDSEDQDPTSGANGLRVTFAADEAFPETAETENRDSDQGDMEFALETIRNYRVGIGGARTPTAQLQTTTQIVNPFRVRRRGRFYGSVYEFHRNDNLDARNFFDPLGEPLPEFKRNQFGVSFGTALTNRINLFGAYDGLRIIQGSTLLSHLPTPDMKRGDFSAHPDVLRDPLQDQPFAGNVIPESRIHPVSRRLLALLPDPNLADPNRNFLNSDPIVRNQDSFSGRLDYGFSKDTKVFADYSLVRNDNANVHPLPGFGSAHRARSQRLSVNYTRTLSQRLVASIRLTLRRDIEQELSANSGKPGLVGSLGIAGLNALDEDDEGYPEFDLSGYGRAGATFGDSSRLPRSSFGNLMGLNSVVTYVYRQHSLGFGAEVELEQINNARSGGLRRGRFAFEGRHTGDAFADFLLGIPDQATRGVGSERADLRGYRWKLFLRDDWKLNPQFNLSFALGYNYFAPYRSVHDNVSIFHPLLFAPPLGGDIVVVGSEQARQLGLTGLGSGETMYPDRNDWEPSLGLAYSPLGNNRLVLRGSYQITYNPVGGQRLLPWFGRNFPFYYVERAESSPLVPQLNLSIPFETAAPPELTIRALDPRMRNEYVQIWLLSVENEIAGHWNLSVSYQGRKGTRLAQVMYGNVAAPGPESVQPRRPNPLFGRFEMGAGRGSSIGHSLELALKKRLTAGFSLQSGFTWNRTLTDRFSDQPSNPYNLRAERALGGMGPRRFFVNYIIDLPFGRGRTFPLPWAGRLRALLEGWRLAGMTTIQDGRPFHPGLRGDINNDGVSGDRPNRLGPGTLSASQRSIDRWFATGDFSVPAPYSYGNAGRNILMGPGEQVWDISLSKQTRVSGEGRLLEFRIELFNAFNHPNFENPNATFGTSVFGRIFGAKRAREIELAIKYSF